MELSSDKLLTARGHHSGRKSSGLGMLIMSVFPSAITLGCLIASIGNAEKYMWATLVFSVFAALLISYGWYSLTVPVRWLCPSCGKRIHANEPWKCGVCNHENKKISWEGAISFLGRCGNDNCQAKAAAYQCQHCEHVMTLIDKQSVLHPARSLNATYVPPVDSLGALRQKRSYELEIKEYDRQHLEADKRILMLEIENARLRQTRNNVDAVELTPRQQSINRIAEQLDDADLFCRTIPDTVERELKMHAEVDAKQFFPDAEKDAYVKAQMKEAISVHFESIRLTLGGNVQIRKEDRR